MSERPVYGGQAVIEGVMMRGPRYFAVACRRASGGIVVKAEPVPAIFTRYPWARWPLLRGVFALADTLALGMKALFYSAELAAQDEAAGRGASPNGKQPSEEPRAVSSFAIGGSGAVGLGLGIFLFVFLPHLIARLIERGGASDLVLNLIEGGLRAAIVIGYIALIGRMKHVQRLFQYHGAEHQAINAWERERALSVAAAARQSLIHPRCGTNFLLLVVLLKLLLYPLFGWPGPVLVALGLRLALLPVVAALAFEVIRVAGKYRDFRPLQLLVAPGLLTQRLTTRKPDEGMLAVSLAALARVIELEEGSVPAPAAPAESAG